MLVSSIDCNDVGFGNGLKRVSVTKGLRAGLKTKSSQKELKYDDVHWEHRYPEMSDEEYRTRLAEDAARKARRKEKWAELKKAIKNFFS